MRPRPIRSSRAFTLAELLVVIGIILVLMGILIPVVGKVRKQAQAANTRNQIAQLGTLIQAYYADFKAYPGPVPNTQLQGSSPDPNNITTPPSVEGDITMAENLYLGLMGGLKPGTTPGEFAYDKNIAGLGPRWLGTTPKKLPPYGDNAEVTNRNGTGDFADESADCGDSVIPEYLDRFPSPMPILYLRARPGIQTPLTPATPVVSKDPSLTSQYDLSQVTSYTSAAHGNFIGEGKSNDGEPRVPADKEFYVHGFTDEPADEPDTNAVTNPGATSPAVYFYPYNINAALRHPTIGAPGSGQAPVPRQKDGYILISAGIDRVYGTKDDITNFGQY